MFEDAALPNIGRITYDQHPAKLVICASPSYRHQAAQVNAELAIPFAPSRNVSGVATPIRNRFFRDEQNCCAIHRLLSPIADPKPS